MNSRHHKSYRFLFDETYRMWKSDLDKIFRIGTRGNKGGCNLSSCILVLIGIESFSKFFCYRRDDSAAFSKFIDTYYPSFYYGKMQKIYKLFRHGLAHNFYPKSEFQLTNASTVAVGVDEHERVVPISRLRKDIDNCRKRTLKLNPLPGKPYVLVPQVLFIDTVNVMESLKKEILDDVTLQELVAANYEKIQKKLGHSN